MRLRQTLLDLRPEGIDVPGQVPVALSQDVVEAPGLDQLDPARTDHAEHHPARGGAQVDRRDRDRAARDTGRFGRDRKSTRLNSSHVAISYAVFCLKMNKITTLIS